jgi:cob(I)alamin adenosyltransferase
MGTGLVVVHTGDGKGKTTAALGLALRAAGDEMRVLVLQFVKSAKKTGELKAAPRLAPWLTIRQVGRGFVRGGDKEIHRRAALKGIEEARAALLSGGYDMVILDEINVAVSLGLIGEEDLLKLIDEKPMRVHLVLTGRNASPSVVERADLVTEMREIKHPYRAGLKAQRGIEY